MYENSNGNGFMKSYSDGTIYYYWLLHYYKCKIKAAVI